MSNTLDYDKTREVLKEHYGIHSDGEYQMVLRALEACVRPLPQQTIDRDALDALLAREFRGHSADQIEATTDRVLALLRPVND